MLVAGHFTEVGGRGAVFAADAQALQQARQQQHDGGGEAYPGIARRQRDDQRTRAHQQHRKRQAGLAPETIGIPAEQPAADRPHEETEREDSGGVELLDDGVAFREEGAGEIEGEGGIGVPVVPFDQVADGTAENGTKSAFRHGPEGFIFMVTGQSC